MAAILKKSHIYEGAKVNTSGEAVYVQAMCDREHRRRVAVGRSGLVKYCPWQEVGVGGGARCVRCVLETPPYQILSQGEYVGDGFPISSNRLICW